jgi:hypothetical protein
MWRYGTPVIIIIDIPSGPSPAEAAKPPSNDPCP